MHWLVLQLAEGLTDNWYVLETCLWGFRLVGIGTVCAYIFWCGKCGKCGKCGHTEIGLEYVDFVRV